MATARHTGFPFIIACLSNGVVLNHLVSFFPPTPSSSLASPRASHLLSPVWWCCRCNALFRLLGTSEWPFLCIFMNFLRMGLVFQIPAQRDECYNASISVPVCLRADFGLWSAVFVSCFAYFSFCLYSKRESSGKRKKVQKKARTTKPNILTLSPHYLLMKTGVNNTHRAGRTRETTRSRCSPRTHPGPNAGSRSVKILI